jgi:hypothetical protein
MLIKFSNLSVIWGDRRGTTILEFALVFPIFLTILFSGIEFGLFLFASNVVQQAVFDGSRLGLTGSSYSSRQSPKDSLSRENYIRKMITERLGPLADNGVLTINTRTFATLNGLNSAGLAVEGTSFGKGGQVVAYDAEFAWNIVTPGILNFLGVEGQLIVTSTAIVKNENFR